MHERVLCFPRQLLDELGSFQGFKPDDGKIIGQILVSGQARFVERMKAEEDPDYKQLIPYVAMRWQNKLLYYVRGKESGEERLRALGSVGIGGHISVADRGLFTGDMTDIFSDGLAREVAEEVDVKTDYRERIVGLINDDSNMVGKVHLGVLVLWELDEGDVVKRERAITSLDFLTEEELAERMEGMETWSQIAVRAIFQGIE